MGLLTNRGEDITITKKMADGGSVTMKSPVGNQMDLGMLGGMVGGNSPTPVADNVPAMLTAGEFVVNQPAAQKYKPLLQQINQEGRMALKQGGWTNHVKPMGYNQGGEAMQQAPQDLYGDEVQGGGSMATEMIRKDPQAYAFMLKKKGMKYEDALILFLQALFPQGVTDAEGMQVERMIAPVYGVKPLGPFGDTAEPIEMAAPGAPQGMWKGGEIMGQASRGAIPDVGDRFNYKGQTVYFDGSYWRYRGGALAPEYIQKEINATVGPAHLMQKLGYKGMWSGGEVPGKMSIGATPEEGDSVSHKGQTVIFKNGKWQYASGSLAPDYITSYIDSKIQGTAEEQAGYSGTTNLKLKEVESKNAGWARRAMEAEAIIRQLYNEGYNPASFARNKEELIAGLTGDSDIFRGEQGQRFRRAMEGFIAAVLRKDTGAQIAKSEYERVAAEMFPSFGTGAKSQQDAANLREAAITSFIEGAGTAGEGLLEQYSTLPTYEQTNEQIVTAEDLGGIAGGIAGAAGGAKVAGKGGGKKRLLTSLISSVLGNQAGRATGQVTDQALAGEDIDLGEAIVPDKADAVDAILTAGGAGVATKGAQLYKLGKDFAKKKGWIGKDFIDAFADDVLKKTNSSVLAQMAGQVPEEVAKKHTGKMFTEVNGKAVFFDQNTGKVFNAYTGKAMPPRSAKMIAAELQKRIDSAAKFNQGGTVRKGLLAGR